MTFKAKLIIIVVLEIFATVVMAGWLSYRESKWKVKELARQLLIAKTDKAFALCEHHYRTSGDSIERLKEEISAVKIAKDGYIAVLSNEPDRKGVLVIHPTDEGTSLYTDEFPHIQKMIDEIDENERAYAYSNFIFYRQGTIARGLQGEKKIGYFKYFKPWNWIVLATGYEKDVFSSREELKQTIFELVALVLIIGVVVVYLTIRTMFRPIQKLTESTQEVAKGNWDISIDHDSKDEIGQLAAAFNRMVQSLRDNMRMWQEFKIARDMQSQMLPKTFPEVEGLDISATSIPATEVGGDFYDFLRFEDKRLGIVVGDVSGHGLSAALVMTAAMGAVRFASEEKHLTDEVLTMVNSRLKKDIQKNMFVALFYAIYDPDTRMLYYTNAGQTMPYLCRDGKIGFLPQARNTDRFPLGIVASCSYEQLSIQLKPGDTLVFYTDGIVDALNGSYESYGFDRFSESIQEFAGHSSRTMVERLISGVKSYSGDSSPDDDVTLVILKVK